MKIRKIVVGKQYLLLPVAESADWFPPPGSTQYLSIWEDGTKKEEYEVTLSAKPRFWGCQYLAPYAGKELELRLEGGNEELLDLVEQADEPRDREALYREPDRPLFHLTPMHGYMNDPNGLTWYRGTYHYFAQLNPYGLGVGNTHWMHAVSDDLLHWKELPYALLPDETGRMYSGGGIVDEENTSGLQTGEDAPIFLFYTPAGGKSRWSGGKAFEIAAAVSLDGGRTFEKYEKNPLIPNLAFMNRDPKVLWDPEGKQWVMAIFLDNDRYQFFFSENMLDWEHGQIYRLYGAAECPDLFRLPLDGDESRMKWVLWGSTDNYVVGRMEGREFVPEYEPVEGPSHQVYSAYSSMARSQGGYAAQTFTCLPQGRVVQISWLRVKPICAPFVSCASIPNEFRLVSTADGPRIAVEPIKEVKTLYTEHFSIENKGLEEFERIPMSASGECMDISLRLGILPHRPIAFSVRGVLIVYEPDLKRLMLPTGAFSVKPEEDVLELRILTDRCSMEIYACGGSFNTALCTVLDPSKTEIKPVYIDPATAVNVDIHKIASTLGSA